MTLYLYKYNNYYNRISKYAATIEEYDAIGTRLYAASGINFNPNDGIDAVQDFNYNGDTPDYVVVTDDSNTILHRWFVIEAVRLRGGQYRLKLYRDVIADYREQVLSATTYIEKATLTPDSNLIFNTENFSTSQIKTNEKLLQDRTKMPWIVGYMSKDYRGTIKLTAQDASIISYTYDDISEYPYYSYASTPMKVLTGKQIYKLRFNFNSEDRYCYAWGKQGEAVAPMTDTYYSNYTYSISSGSDRIGYTFIRPETQIAYGGKLCGMNASLPKYDWSAFNAADYFSGTQSQSERDLLFAERGKVISVAGKLYKISVKKNETTYPNTSITASSALGIEMEKVASYLVSQGYLGTPIVEPRFQLQVEIANYQLVLQEMTDLELTCDLQSDHIHTRSTPYDIFCIPYGELYWNSATYNSKTNQLMALQFAAALTEQLGTNLYDIQLLPYCPLSQAIITGFYSSVNPVANIPNPRIGQPLIHGETSRIFSGLIWVEEPSFEVVIPAEQAIAVTPPADPIDFKVAAQCDMYRIVSPNYNGQFEFNAVKNGGIRQYNVDCTYMPFQPYIKVSPAFERLYGRDYDDARGMICGGDFSLTQTSDAWVQYQIQNKTYSLQFNRQIENLETMGNYAQTQQVIGGIVGTLSGIATGALVGGPIGAAVGGISSLGGGVADFFLNKAQRQETIDYTKDQFNYSLQNIQATPDSLTKVSSLNKNNKLFPFVEYYTCSNVEKEAFRNKIRYNGMTVMAIGKVEDYLREEPTYIKGKIIRIENVYDDFHIVNSISEELNKGVFI